MRNSEGFTLIELLIVIAIIAILAAILFPVFLRAKGAAQTAVCLDNLSQLGKAVVMYRDDHGDRLPLNIGWYGSSASPYASCKGYYQTYYMLLTKYTKTQTGSFFCPCAYAGYLATSDIKPPRYPCRAVGLGMMLQDYKAGICPDPAVAFGYKYKDEFTATSYAAFLYPDNLSSRNVTNPGQWDCYAVSASYDKPSRSVYLFEAKYDFIQDWDQASTRAEDKIVATGGDGYATPRHNGFTQINCAFYDGHVQTLGWDYFSKNAEKLFERKGRPKS